MIWTIVAILAVMATRAVTAFRLKDLKATLEGIAPKIMDLRREVKEAEEELNEFKARETTSKTKVANLRAAVQYLENTVKGPPGDVGMVDEREMVLAAAEDTD